MLVFDRFDKDFTSGIVCLFGAKIIQFGEYL